MILEGYKPFYEEIEHINANAKAYRTGLKPPHLFISGIGSEYEKKEIILAYMAERFEKAGVIDFSLAYDRYLCFNITCHNIQDTFYSIASSAIGTNHYRYLLGLDVTSLIPRFNTPQVNDFFHRIDTVSKYCTCVFLSSRESANTERFIEKLNSTVGEIKHIRNIALTPRDLTFLVKRKLEEEYLIACSTSFEKAMAEFLGRHSNASANDVFRMLPQLVRLANFASTPPLIDDTIDFEHLDINITKSERRIKP